MPDDVVCLARVRRGGKIESEHFGQVAVVHADGKIDRTIGSGDIATFLRSSAKPFQAMTVLATGADKRFAWTHAERAVIAASHDASQEHLALVLGMLTRAGLTESALRCGPHPPINSAVRDELIRQWERPRPLHNNCSGKHAGMLSACVAAGWPTDRYENPDHPLQQAIKTNVARWADLSPAALPVARDGCAVPTFYMPIASLALLFARLAAPATLTDEAGPAALSVRDAMIEFPHLVSWRGHLTDTLGKHLGKRVVSKGGAEGVFGIGLPELALGIGIKCSDGSARAIPAIACRILAEYLPDADWQAIRQAVNPPLVNTRQEEVGEIEPAF